MGRAHEEWRLLESEAGETLLSTTGGIDILNRGDNLEAAFTASCSRNRVALKELQPVDLDAFGLRLRSGTVAYWQPESGVLHATSAVSALQRLAAVHGAILRDNCEVTQVLDDFDDRGCRIAVVVARDGRRWLGRRVIIAPGAWAGPTLRALCGLHVNIEVVQVCVGPAFGLALPSKVLASEDSRSVPLQTTVMYFRASSTFVAPSGTTADQLLLKQPVVIDYGDGSSWTSTSSGKPEGCPLIYSCPSIEFPGLIKFAVHLGTVTTAASRCVRVS